MKSECNPNGNPLPCLSALQEQEQLMNKIQTLIDKQDQQVCQVIHKYVEQFPITTCTFTLSRILQYATKACAEETGHPGSSADRRESNKEPVS